MAVFVAHVLLQYDLTLLPQPPPKPQGWLQALCPSDQLRVQTSSGSPQQAALEPPTEPELPSSLIPQGRCTKCHSMLYSC